MEEQQALPKVLSSEQGFQEARRVVPGYLAEPRFWMVRQEADPRGAQAELWHLNREQGREQSREEARAVAKTGQRDRRPTGTASQAHEAQAGTRGGGWAQFHNMGSLQCIADPSYGGVLVSRGLILCHLVLPCPLPPPSAARPPYTFQLIN